MGKYNIEHQGSLDVYKVTRKENPFGKVIGGIVMVFLALAMIGSCTEHKGTAAETPAAIHGQQGEAR